MTSDGHDEFDLAPAAADPSADLFLSLVAVILPAIMLMLPIAMEREALPVRNRQISDLIVNTDIRVRGQNAELIWAGADGVRFGRNHRVALQAMIDDDALEQKLAQLRQQERPLLLVIEPDGLETAFLLERLIAEHGPNRLYQLRLDGSCMFARGALASTCTRLLGQL